MGNSKYRQHTDNPKILQIINNITNNIQYYEYYKHSMIDKMLILAKVTTAIAYYKNRNNLSNNIETRSEKSTTTTTTRA